MQYWISTFYNKDSKEAFLATIIYLRIEKDSLLVTVANVDEIIFVCNNNV
jgi:hypothetical protein